jgi:NAD(P)-dependent dehydrogenase (short-subunit alcohol dehydrogenase family)
VNESTHLEAIRALDTDALHALPVMGLVGAVSAFALDCAWTQAELLVQAVLVHLLLLTAPIFHLAYLLGNGRAGFARSRSRARAKAYLITGASQGIGAALAVRLAKDPATCALYLVGRAEPRMGDVRRACASVASRPTLRIVVLEADVQDRAAMRRAILQANQDERDSGSGGLTAVVANAGVTQKTLDPSSSAGFAVAADILNINMMGTIHTVEPAVDIFAKRGHGQIVIISSVASFYAGVPAMTAYSSSKVAQRVFGECLRSRLSFAPVFEALTILKRLCVEMRVTATNYLRALTSHCRSPEFAECALLCRPIPLSAGQPHSRRMVWMFSRYAPGLCEPG